MNHKHFLRLAKECSHNSTYSNHRRVQIGCLLVYKGSILAKGWNTERTHTHQMRYNTFRFNAIDSYPSKLHAEISVLSKVKYLDIDFSKTILYIYREYNDGSPAMARCCPSCFAAAKALNIGTIVYTTENGYAVEKIL
jgi:tRNA(Arg) A34 adenosine deaminase TadA